MSGKDRPKRVGRVAIGCNACRVRHVRCDKNLPSCLACLKAGIECVRSLQVRFRNGLDSVDEDYSFSDTQTWVQHEKDLEYCDETAQLSQLYEGTIPEVEE
ncbi:hypothetical protein QQX98_003596 [Neonectria punicea]|uniref:Zn(2)-C6 fungal-type domain-containing protein n=1 Tax=Neonectria punicea TaxID=979145 RepID=A0ABR1HD55_9HYPO